MKLSYSVASAAIGMSLLFAPVQASAETLRFAHHHSVGGFIDKFATKFAELVKEKTNGEVDVRIIPGGQLGQERELFDLINNGGIDATFTSLGMMDTYYPAIVVTSYPFAFKSWEHASKAFNGEFGDRIKAGLKEKSNTEIVGWLENGFRDLIFRDAPVTKLADMKGVNMRSAESHTWIRMYELMGARPTPITWGEIYLSMQTGVIAGFDSPAFAALDMKFNEVTKSLVKTNQMFAVGAIVVNKNKMATLTESQQAAVTAAGNEAGIFINETVMKPGADGAYKKMQEIGMTVVEPENPDEWRTAMLPLWDELSAKYEGAGELLKILQATE